MDERRLKEIMDGVRSDFARGMIDKHTYERNMKLLYKEMARLQSQRSYQPYNNKYSIYQQLYNTSPLQPTEPIMTVTDNDQLKYLTEVLALEGGADLVRDVNAGRKYKLPLTKSTFKEIANHELRYAAEKLFGGNFPMRDPLRTATVWIDPLTRMIALRTPYSQFIVSSIKTTIPDGLRQWDKDKKVWLIDRSCMDKLESMLSNLGFNIEDGTTPQEQQAAVVASKSNGDSPYHRLIKDLPMSTLRKVYRVILMEHHPDKGGSHELSVTVNQAWKEIEEDKK